MGEDEIRKSTNVLKMSWICNNNRTMTWNLKYPKETVTKVQVETFMNMMISEDAILYGNDEASDIKEYYIYKTRTIEIPS